MLYIIFFLLLGYVLIFLTNTRQCGVIALVLSIAYLILAYPSGNDWLGYFSNYDCIWNDVCQPDSVYFEPGYTFLVYALGFAGYYLFSIILSGLVLIRLYYFCCKFDKPALVFSFFMAMFIWVLYFEAIRQALALTFILSAIIEVYRQRKMRFILFVLAASLFHTSAFIFVVMLIPMLNCRLSKKLETLVLIFACCFILIPEQLISFLISCMPSNSPVALKLYFYLNTEQYKPQLSIGIGALFDLVLIYVIVFSRRLIYSLNYHTNDKYYYMNAVTSFGVVLFITFAILIGKVMPVMTRVGWYFFPFIVFCIYVNLGRSIIFPYIPTKNIFIKYLIFLFMAIQTLRPFMYDISRYNLVTQKTIVQRIDDLTDSQLRLEAKKKCDVLYSLDAGFLCSL
ncbi:EpsG family protein [Citrobacter amalonaticus]|uniref:EpsG family protein n=1 Tax=Citrobacter amalonaticus TaxID=35703 RepID=UPI00300C5E73